MNRRSKVFACTLVAVGAIWWSAEAWAAQGLAPQMQAALYAKDRISGFQGDVPTAILGRAHRYYIEVPYKSRNLTVRIYDPAFGWVRHEPARPEYDFPEASGGRYDSSICFELLDPDGNVPPNPSGVNNGEFTFAAAREGETNCAWLDSKSSDFRPNTSYGTDGIPGCDGNGEVNCCDHLAGEDKYIEFSVSDDGSTVLEPGHWILDVDTTRGCRIGSGSTYPFDDIAGFKIHAYDASSGTEFNVYSEWVTLATAQYAKHPDVLTYQFRYYPYIQGGESFNVYLYNETGVLKEFTLASTSWRWNPSNDDYGPEDATPDTPVGREPYTTWYKHVRDYSYGDPATGDVSASPDSNGIWTIGWVDDRWKNPDAVYQTNSPDGSSVATIWIEDYTGKIDVPNADSNDTMFRIYLPEDPNADSLPKKPFVAQYLHYLDGDKNPPGPNQSATYQGTILFYVPYGTKGDVYFDNGFGHTVTFQVPSGGGLADVQFRSGSSKSTVPDSWREPDQTGPGYWFPGAISPKEDPAVCCRTPPCPECLQGEEYTYEILFTRRESGGVSLTGTPGDATYPGTRAIWRDETSKPGSDGIKPMLITNSRGTGDTGETTGTGTSDTEASPTRASVVDVQARVSGGNGVLEWRTASEVGSVAFRAYRVDAEQTIVPVGGWVPTEPGRSAGGDYWVAAPELAGSSASSATLYVDEADARGRIERHGPFVVPVAAAGPLPALGAPGWSSTARAYRPLPTAPTLETAIPWKSAAGGERRAYVHVELAGIYRVTSSALATALGSSDTEIQQLIASAGLRVTRGGEPVAYLPESDGLVFYGWPSESVFTDAGIYRFERGKGLQIEADAAPTPAAPSATASFTTAQPYQRDERPAPAIATRAGGTYWMWDYLLVAGGSGTDRGSYDIDVPAVAPVGAPARLTAWLHGGSTATSGDNHHVRLYLNGSLLADETFRGKVPHTLDVEIPSGVLQSGANTVEVEALLDPGVPYGVVYVDRFSVKYERTFAATDGVARLWSTDDPVVTVTGLATEDAVVLDLTAPRQPRLVAGALSGTDANGATLSFTAAGPRRPYFVAETSAIADLPVIGATSTPLAKSTIGCQYLIIAASHLVGAARRLADLRSDQGLTTRVVDVREVYEEYADGAPDPYAIAAFVRTAYSQWDTPPRYVVLVGDGTYDHRDILGHGDNLVSPRLTYTQDGMFAGDTLVGDVAGRDGMPEIIVGRIPVITVEELNAYIDKIEAFEAGVGEDWAARALVAADNDDEGGTFMGEALRARATLDSAFSVDLASLDEQSLEGARDIVRTSLEDGVRLVSYTGHAGMDRMAAEGLLTIDDLASIGDSGKPPVFITASCLLGRFAVPGIRSLTEELLVQENGGAVAVIGSAGLEYNAESTVITNAILESVAIAKTRRLGDAFAYGLAESVNRHVPRDSRQLFNLLGDPALMLYPESVDEQAAPLPAQGCDCRGDRGSAGLLSLAALGLLLRRRRRPRSARNRRQSAGSDLC